MGKRNGLRKVVFFKMHFQNGSNSNTTTTTTTTCSSLSDEDLGKVSCNNKSVQWKECKWWEENQHVEHVANYCTSSDQLKVLQFNILNDDMVNETLTEKISTQKRFDYIAHQLLPNTNADLICLNEVGNGFLKKLLDECSDGWMKEGKYFYISHLDQERFFEIPSNKVIPQEQDKKLKKNTKKAVDDATQMTVEKASFVNLVISRIPFTQSHNYYYQNDLVYSRRPANVITLVNQMVVVNLHLKAYKECHPIRKKQLKCLYSLFRIPRVDFKMHEENKESSQSSIILEDENRFTFHFGIEELNPKALLFEEKKEFSATYENVKYVLMCGDFNLNHDFEEHMISDYDVVDVYAKLYPEKVGSVESLTFDYQNNPIVNLFSEDSRGRCRYDRMLVHCRDIAKSNLRIESTSCQVVENQAFEDNVFASDHFGLLSEFSITKE